MDGIYNYKAERKIHTSSVAEWLGRSPRVWEVGGSIPGRVQKNSTTNWQLLIYKLELHGWNIKYAEVVLHEAVHEAVHKAVHKAVLLL